MWQTTFIFRNNETGNESVILATGKDYNDCYKKAVEFNYPFKPDLETFWMLEAVEVEDDLIFDFEDDE